MIKRKRKGEKRKRNPERKKRIVKDERARRGRKGQGRNIRRERRGGVRS